MFKLLAVCKLVAAPVAAPLALTLVVAFAGPGGVLEPRAELRQQDSPGAASTNGGSSSDSAVSSAALADDEAAPDSTVATNGAVDQPGDGPGDEIAPAGDADEDPGCVEALTVHAEARPTLEEHVADPDNSEGGAEGNQNALDQQCGGAFAAGDAAEVSADGATDAPQDISGGGNGNANGNSNGNDNANGQDKPDEKTKDD